MRTMMQRMRTMTDDVRLAMFVIQGSIPSCTISLPIPQLKASTICVYARDTRPSGTINSFLMRPASRERFSNWCSFYVCVITLEQPVMRIHDFDRNDEI